MNDKIKMTVEMEVTEAQALTLQAMFRCWNSYGHTGMSRNVGFFVDGDGNFHPKCKVSFDGDVRELTQDMIEKSIVKERDGNLLFDYDPVAWMINDEWKKIKTFPEEEDEDKPLTKCNYCEQEKRE